MGGARGHLAHQLVDPWKGSVGLLMRYELWGNFSTKGIFDVCGETGLEANIGSCLHFDRPAGRSSGDVIHHSPD